MHLTRTKLSYQEAYRSTVARTQESASVLQHSPVGSRYRVNYKVCMTTPVLLLPHSMVLTTYERGVKAMVR